MDNQIIYCLLFLLIGLVFTIIGFSKRSQRINLIKNGVKAEGVVYSVEKDFSGTLGNQSVTYYPVIRYLTQEKDWVTEKYDVGLGSIGSYNEGDKVTVIYDPNCNTQFIIDDKSTKYIGPIFIVLGAGLIVASIVCYLLKIQIHHS